MEASAKNDYSMNTYSGSVQLLLLINDHQLLIAINCLGTRKRVNAWKFLVQINHGCAVIANRIGAIEQLPVYVHEGMARD